MADYVGKALSLTLTTPSVSISGVGTYSFNFGRTINTFSGVGKKPGTYVSEDGETLTVEIRDFTEAVKIEQGMVVCGVTFEAGGIIGGGGECGSVSLQLSTSKKYKIQMTKAIVESYDVSGSDDGSPATVSITLRAANFAGTDSVTTATFA